MTNPFAQLSSGGSWIKPADHNGHLVIIANVRAPYGRKYDEMRKAEVDVATFDFADLDNGQGWQTAVQNSHAGFTNKLTGIIGQPGGMVLARVGQVQATNGHLAWVLAEPEAADVARASAWVASNPAASTSLFTAPAAAPVAAPAPVVAAAPVAHPAAPLAAPAAQGDVAALLAQLQAAQAVAG